MFDHDEDGDLDLIGWETAASGEFRVFTADGAGGYSLFDNEVVADLSHVLVADLDGDGDSDVFVVRYDFVTPAMQPHQLYVRD
jgi:hypothetical protein